MNYLEQNILEPTASEEMERVHGRGLFNAYATICQKVEKLIDEEKVDIDQDKFNNLDEHFPIMTADGFANYFNEFMNLLPKGTVEAMMIEVLEKRFGW